MLIGERSGVDELVIFCLHYLGGSAREWTQVASRLAGHVRCVGIDLPGFGDAAQTPGYTVADMAAIVARAVHSQAPRRWLLAGHSMGAKIAAVLARSAQDGSEELMGLEGLILLAGSPPSPEPMDEDQRQTMLGWFAGDLNSSQAQAQQYIAQNSGPKLSPILADEAAADVLRANRSAWQAWLNGGSREDWSDRVGVIQTPTLVIAGADDENLGPAAQRSLTAPHFAHVRLVTLPGAKHLLPMESPHEVARLIDEHADSINREHERATLASEGYRVLIASDRVSAGTREALLARDRPDDPNYQPIALDATGLASLRAVLNRVLPQLGAARIDLAARIDQQLGAEAGDGWRFADLPLDADAYRAGLLTLSDAAQKKYAAAFAHLNGRQQDDLLTVVAAGPIETTVGDVAPPGGLNAGQMQLWFEDVRADAVKVYVAHPETLARIGYSGIANGGDGQPKSGFIRVGIAEREAWEPVAATDASA